jgi:hypothetical protein
VDIATLIKIFAVDAIVLFFHLLPFKPLTSTNTKWFYKKWQRPQQMLFLLSQRRIWKSIYQAGTAAQPVNGTKSIRRPVQPGITPVGFHLALHAKTTRQFPRISWIAARGMVGQLFVLLVKRLAYQLASNIC